MLVLSRKTSQRIQIGDSVILTVVKIGGNTVRLGIEAPADVAVLREELLSTADVPADVAEAPWAAPGRILPREVFDKHSLRGYLPA